MYFSLKIEITSNGASYGFLSAIFGTLGKFYIDIGVQIFFEIFFFEMKKFSQKIYFSKILKILKNLKIFDFTKDFLIDSIRKSLVNSKILRFFKIFKIFEKHIF